VKLRLLPVVVTILASSAVLFGGWFAYQSYAMEDPFLKETAAIEGVAGATVELGRDQAIVHVTLAEGAKLREAYQAVVEAGRASLGKRSVVVDVVGEGGTSPALEEWWSGALFDVAQAMETKQYARIPERLKELAASQGNLQVKTEMDETNVYIALTDGPNSKYVVLPRTAATMGVWPNE